MIWCNSKADGYSPDERRTVIIFLLCYNLYVDINNKVLVKDKQNIKANNTAFTGALFTTPLSAAKPPYNSLGDDEIIINLMNHLS